MNPNFINWSFFFKGIPAKGLDIAGNKREEDFLTYYPTLYNLALLEMFALINVEHGKPEKGKGWRIIRVQRTSFGDALLSLLSEHFPDQAFFLDDVEDDDEDEDEEHNVNNDEENEGDVPLGQLQSILQPFFPEWQKNLIVPKPVFQEGAYYFKVSLGSIWRRIAIGGKNSFESFSYCILDSFDFDDDHLYSFTYRNRFGVPIKINHPSMDESPWVDKVLIGKIGLTPHKTLTFLYDFGDNWEFEVTLERIEPSNRKIKKPIILESHGEAPEQYPSWEE